MMEIVYLQALVGVMVDRMDQRWHPDDTDEERYERLRGDGGYSLETVLIAGLLAALAFGAMAVITVKVMNRAKGIDGGDAPTAITIPQ